jgi:DNA-directed RNA polymerase subunit E'/Rpb7
MFSTITLKDTVKIHSCQIGPNIKERIIHSLKKNYEKKVLGKINGYIIEIVDVNEDTIKDGVINDINGDTNYKLEYTAVMFRPIKKDILNITVDHCNDLGIWGHSTILPDVSIIECICTKNYLPKGFTFEEESEKWVSDYETIEEGSDIQLQVLDTQIDATKMLIIGNIVFDNHEIK